MPSIISNLKNMKYFFSLIAILAFNLCYAQTFQWNKKSVEPMAQEVQPTDDALEKAYNERQTGQVGVYNPSLQGRLTAYGETYVNKQMTASHAVLPLGTIVRVQSMDNGRVISVRINDKGQECADCLLTVTPEAAFYLGINYRARVTVERTGFSNWNPAPPTTQTAAVSTPQTYQQPTTFMPPVQVNRNDQWQARGTTAVPSPDVYGRSVPTQSQSPLAYGNQNNTQVPVAFNRTSVYDVQASDNYTALNAPMAPSVASREVQPATVSRQPVTYSRYPTATSNTQVRTYEPASRVYAPVPNAAYQQPSAPTAYGQVPTQQQPATTTQQAPPPASTVMRYQESRTVAAPSTYGAPAVNPQVYGAPSQQQARFVAPAASTAAPVSGYAVQLGAYSNEVYAQNRVNQLNKLGLSNIFYQTVQKPDGQLINRVYAGTFANMAEAQTAARLIQGNYQIAGIVSSL